MSKYYNDKSTLLTNTQYINGFIFTWTLKYSEVGTSIKNSVHFKLYSSHVAPHLTPVLQNILWWEPKRFFIEFKIQFFTVCTPVLQKYFWTKVENYQWNCQSVMFIYATEMEHEDLWYSMTKITFMNTVVLMFNIY